MIEHHYYDIGVAVGTERGLVVPVLRDCDQMTLWKSSKESSVLLKRRERGITLGDMQGGCFTITNGGIYGHRFPPLLSILLKVEFWVCI